MATYRELIIKWDDDNIIAEDVAISSSIIGLNVWTWVATRGAGFEVTTGTPTGIPGERTAINFKIAFDLDFPTGFVTSIVDNVVRIASEDEDETFGDVLGVNTLSVYISNPLVEDKLLNAFNNNILEFQTAVSFQPSEKATITIGTYVFEITPVQWYYRFNFKEVMSRIINPNRFVDSLVPVLLPADITSHIYDDIANTLYNSPVSITVTLAGGVDTVTFTLGPTFFKSVEQLEQHKRDVVTGGEGMLILSPFLRDTTNTYNLTYFEGYPFDFGIYLETPATVNLLNTTNGLDVDLVLPTKVSRVFLGDGRTTLTIEDHLPLVDGLNEITVTTAGVGTIYLKLRKVPARKGVYIKWQNQYGEWCHWLFNCIHKRDRKMKNLEDIGNDYDNVEDTINSFISIGKNNKDKLTLIAEGVDQYDQLIMSDLADSPMIYLFTGVHLSQVDNVSWLGIKMTSSTIAIEDYKTKQFKYKLTFELPERYTMTL